MPTQVRAKGNGEEGVAELGVTVATRPCHCIAMPCRCFFTTKTTSTHALGSPDNATRIVSNTTVANQSDKHTTSIDVVQQTILEKNTDVRITKRTREARGWDTRASLGSNKKQAMEKGNRDSLDVELGRRTRLRDTKAGEAVDSRPEEGR